MRSGRIGRFGLAAVPVAGLLVLAACSGGGGGGNGGGGESGVGTSTGQVAEPARASGAAAPGGGVDPCALVTPAEVAATTGVPVTGQAADPATHTCTYRLASAEEDAVDVLAARHTSALLAFSGGKERVPGLGEQAFWDGTTRSLDMLKSRTQVFITFKGFVEPLGGRHKAVAISIGEKALSRIP